ncbi:twin-arginine translocase TatA/TatE family subunit [Halobacteriales archaeon QS_5_70_17]|nr:MAG: twin-arginine translocase TatA/TatE family subunit [Halobacteriales archaeon QS_5_70_17]
MYEPAPLFPGVPGGIEIFVVLLIVVLLFGANKLPKLARSSGQAMGEFRRGREQVESELREMQSSATEDADGTPTTEGTDARGVTDADVEPDPEPAGASAD